MRSAAAKLMIFTGCTTTLILEVCGPFIAGIKIANFGCGFLTNGILPNLILNL